MSFLVAAPALPALFHLLARLPVRPAPAASLLLPLLQEFSADMNSRPVKRVEDVSRLRAAQFSEDNGELGVVALAVADCSCRHGCACCSRFSAFSGCWMLESYMHATYNPLGPPCVPFRCLVLPCFFTACPSMCLRHFDFPFLEKLEIIEISI